MIRGPRHPQARDLPCYKGHILDGFQSGNPFWPGVWRDRRIGGLEPISKRCARKSSCSLEFCRQTTSLSNPVTPELPQLLSSAFLRLSSAAVLIFLATSAGAGVVTTYFRCFPPYGGYDQLEFVPVFFAFLFMGRPEIFAARQWTGRSSRQRTRFRSLRKVERKGG